MMSFFFYLLLCVLHFFSFFFFFNDTATTEIYTLSLHDALPICRCGARISETSLSSRIVRPTDRATSACSTIRWADDPGDRKSTRLNSSHSQISYAVFCLKKKKI